MKRFVPTLALASALLAPLWSLPAGAGTGSWTLDADASSLNVVSIKNNSIAEVHRFPDLSGAIGADGEATLSVGLDSVQTGIGIRRLSITPASVGPHKAMFRKIDTRELAEQMEQWLNEPVSDLRGALTEWADEREIEWE